MISPLRYFYFDVVMGLAQSCDPESCAGGSVATGGVSYVGQVKRDALVLQVWVERWVDSPTPVGTLDFLDNFKDCSRTETS